MPRPFVWRKRRCRRRALLRFSGAPAEPTAPLTAAAIDPDLWCLFDQYVHGDIDRRGFLDRAARLAAASGTTAAALLAEIGRAHV